MSQRLHIVTRLHRSPGAPSGEPGDQLELSAWIDADGRIANLGSPPFARLLVDGNEVWRGDLIPTETGWALGKQSGDDPLYPLEIDRVRPGDYLTLRKPDGQAFVYRVVNATSPDR